MANIGIDLGTTNSLVAAVLSGKARVLLDEMSAASFQVLWYCRRTAQLWHWVRMPLVEA